MGLKLLTIGDSLTQGFRSGGTGDPDWSYPAILARALGNDVGAQFRVPRIPGHGLPLNLEELFYRRLHRFGPDISSWQLLKVAKTIADFVDETEQYYEKGPGSRGLGENTVFHNLGSYGLTTFEVAHLTSATCDEIIQEDEGLFQDDLLELPSGSKYRSARFILNPSGDPRRSGATILDNVEMLVNGNTALGIEPETPDAVVVWLGANDCLGTVVTLEVNDMVDGADPPDTVQGRRQFNLTSTAQFAKDYQTVTNRLAQILEGKPTHVYLVTVPDVTIPPITTGHGTLRDGLFDYYTRFLVPPGAFHLRFLVKDLSRSQVSRIQQRIHSFNGIIDHEAKARGWHKVDLGGVLNSLAIRRQGLDKTPELALRRYYERRNQPNHPLLRDVGRVPSLAALQLHQNRRARGGLTSLDFVHPTVVGYGIAAEEILRVMRDDTKQAPADASIPWAEVIEQDALLKAPPETWDDILAAGQTSLLAPLWDLLARIAD